MTEDWFAREDKGINEEIEPVRFGDKSRKSAYTDLRAEGRKETERNTILQRGHKEFNGIRRVRE